VLQVGGALGGSGTLMLTNIGGTLAPGDSFQLFNASSYGVAFTNILPAIPRVGLGWDTTSLNASGTLKVTTGSLPPSPGITGVTLSGGSLVMSGTNGVRGGTYYVLTSTDPSLPLASWSRIATNVFDTSGNFICTNTMTAGSPQCFYLLQLQ
jgi:hypothetical protein